jgi:hypothetical protein
MKSKLVNNQILCRTQKDGNLLLNYKIFQEPYYELGLAKSLFPFSYCFINHLKIIHS